MILRGVPVVECGALDACAEHLCGIRGRGLRKRIAHGREHARRACERKPLLQIVPLNQRELRGFYETQFAVFR